MLLSKQEDNIDLFITRGRHSKIDIYYISQSYFNLPKKTFRNKSNSRKWHSESADPAKALDLSLAKQTNKQTNKKFCPHRGSKSRPSHF